VAGLSGHSNAAISPTRHPPSPLSNRIKWLRQPIERADSQHDETPVGHTVHPIFLLQCSCYFYCNVVEFVAMSDNLGDFEQLVMLAVLRLDDEAYGTSIREELKVRAERDVSPGAIFTTLERLEARGLVSSRYGEPTAERGGRSKRFYKLTADGRRALARALRTVRRMVQGLEPKLERL
jgi:PadR family transcriptional regulator PadR